MFVSWFASGACRSRASHVKTLKSETSVWFERTLLTLSVNWYCKFIRMAIRTNLIFVNVMQQQRFCGSSTHPLLRRRNHSLQSGHCMMRRSSGSIKRQKRYITHHRDSQPRISKWMGSSSGIVASWWWWRRLLCQVTAKHLFSRLLTEGSHKVSH